MAELTYVFIFGLIVGSFLNVCIYRLPKSESIIYPGSHCPSCSHDLTRWDLIPVVSFIFLKGRCRYCQTKISVKYPLVEFLTGIAYGLLYLHFGLSLEMVMYAIFTSILILLTIIDWEHMILPTSVILWGAGLGLSFRLLQAVQYDNWWILGEAMLAGGLGYGLFWLIFYGAKLALKKEGLGFGDVRLMGMLGLYLSVSLIFFVLFIASLLASFYGLMLCYRKKASEPFPLGPFLNGAAILAVFYGEKLMGWYGRWIGF